MQPDDLERRLTDLAESARASRADLRGRILGAVDAALTSPTPFLARPAPWIAAALLLAGLVGGGTLEEHRHERRYRAWVGDAPTTPTTPEALRAFLRGPSVLARFDMEGDR